MERTATKFVVFLTLCMAFYGKTSESVPALTLSEPSRVYLAVGNSLTVNCSIVATNSPHPGGVRLVWTYEGRQLVGSNNSVTSLELNHVTYSTAGVYACEAVSGATSVEVIAKKNLTVIIGVPPAHPDKAVIDHIYGYPSNTGALSYQTLPADPRYAVTYQLLLSPNGCYDVTNFLQYLPAHACTTIQHDSVPHGVKCDVGEVLRRCDWSRASECDDGFPMANCKLLSAVVQVTNVFGTNYSPYAGWRLDIYSTCGVPRNLRVTESLRTSITLSWDIPLALVNISKSKSQIFFKIQWAPQSSLSDTTTLQFEASVKQGTWSGTVSSLSEFKLYAFRVSCSFVVEFSSSEPYATVSAWTKEGVPTSPLKISDFESIPTNDVLRSIRIEWKQLDADSLRGHFRKYVIKYCEGHYDVSSNGSDVITKEIRKNVDSVTLEGLKRYKNYTFSISVCNNGGWCSEPKVYEVLSDTRHPSAQAVAGRPKQPVYYWQIIVTIGVIGAVVLLLIVYLSYKNRPRRVDLPGPLPPDDDLKPLEFSTTDPVVQEPEEYCEVIVPDDVTSAPKSCISRSSSSATCSTEV